MIFMTVVAEVEAAEDEAHLDASPPPHCWCTTPPPNYPHSQRLKRGSLSTGSRGQMGGENGHSTPSS